ncbi:MAG: glycosyltransferase family 2 protein, partial [Caldilineaceae bacterium]
KGACLLVRRDVLEQVGGLDEAFFIYSEEVDLCKRIQQAGWRLYWLPQAEVIHYGAQSTQLVARAMFLNLYRYKVLYFRKRHGERAAALYKVILLLASLARLAASPVACLLARKKRRQCHALTGNYWRLLRLLPDF